MLFTYSAPLAWLIVGALKLDHSVATFNARLEFHTLADPNRISNLSMNTKVEEEYGLEHRAAVRQGCEELCNFGAQGVPGKYFNEVRKQVDCEGLFSNTLNDAPAKMWPPPRDIPTSMFDDFTLNGTATVQKWWFEQQYSGQDMRNNIWTATDVNKQISLAREGKLSGTYGIETTRRLYRFIEKHADTVRGKRLFVIGSEKPWVEAILLQLGAEHVTTIEYGRIKSKHPRITTITPSEVRQIFLASKGKEPKFDGGITFSSIEHSGLGRYGDTLNPWGDIQAIGKAWCITKDAGSMLVGVPSREVDFLTWNAHRQYGPTRWSHLMANWRQLDREDAAKQPTYSPGHTYIFQKIKSLF